jgi:hypothetical protein
MLSISFHHVNQLHDGISITWMAMNLTGDNMFLRILLDYRTKKMMSYLSLGQFRIVMLKQGHCLAGDGEVFAKHRQVLHVKDL